MSKDSIDIGVVIRYLVVSISLAYFLRNLFEPDVSVFFLSVIVLVLLYVITYVSIKKTNLDEWWQANILHTGLTCDCSDCKEWRNEKKVLTTRVLSFLGVLMLLMILLPFVNFGGSNGPVREVEQSAEFVADFRKLKVELRTKKVTEYYKVEKIPSEELVKEKKGDYYIIDLNLAKYGEAVFFNEGEYIIEDFEARLYEPINKFMKEVYYYLDEGATCELFVKGSADIKGNSTFSETLTRGYEYRSIKYLPKIGASQFSHSEKVYKVGNLYFNSDLPNLRAQFIKEKIEANFEEIDEVRILEGMVEMEESEFLRNAFMILYVDFENQSVKG